MARYVSLSHTFMGGSYVVSSHHISRKLKNDGNSILHISDPVSILKTLISQDKEAKLKWFFRGKNFSPREHVLQWVPRSIIPLSFWRFKIFFPFILIDLIRISIAINSFKPDFILIDHRYYSPILNLLSKKIHVIYRPTDLAKNRYEEKCEKQILRHVDGVIATHPEIMARIETSVSKIILENGFDRQHFRVPNKTSNIRSGAIYVGSMDSRFDWDAVLNIAKIIYPHNVVIYGSGKVISNLPDNIQVHEPISYELLPKVFSKYKYGLLPLKNVDLNYGRSPMKLWEYLASDLIVITENSFAGKFKTRKNMLLYNAENRVQTWRLFAEKLNSFQLEKIDDNIFIETDWKHISDEISRFCHKCLKRPGFNQESTGS